MEDIDINITSSSEESLEIILEKPEEQKVEEKNAYDFEIDEIENKPWKKPGADITDYFNYGFDEVSWKIYCNKQRNLRHRNRKYKGDREYDINKKYERVKKKYEEIKKRYNDGDSKKMEEKLEENKKYDSIRDDTKENAKSEKEVYKTNFNDQIDRGSSFSENKFDVGNKKIEEVKDSNFTEKNEYENNKYNLAERKKYDNRMNEYEDQRRYNDRRDEFDQRFYDDRRNNYDDRRDYVDRRNIYDDRWDYKRKYRFEDRNYSRKRWKNNQKNYDDQYYRR